MNASVKRIIIIAGPNGAGKTTFAREFLPGEAGCPDFINADLIVQGLSPFDPETGAIQAGKIMLAQIFRKVNRGESFAFETTLAGRNYVQRIQRWRREGYYVKLIFLSLPAAEVAMARVKARVQQGGHDIPEEVVRRRFNVGWKNFQGIYCALVDMWMLYDNSDAIPRLIASGENR